MKYILYKSALLKAVLTYKYDMYYIILYTY